MEWLLDLWPYWSLLLLGFFFPHCAPCCEDSATATVTDTVGCSACPDTGIPEQWILTVSGVINDSCLECEAPDTSGDTGYNGTFTLSHTPALGACTWGTNIAGGSGETRLCSGIFTGTGHRWRLAYNGSQNRWEVFATSNLGNVVFAIDEEDFDCLGPNTLDYIVADDDHEGCGWPGSVSIVPD